MNDNFGAGFHFSFVSPDPLFDARQSFLCLAQSELGFVDSQPAGLDGFRHVGQSRGQQFLLRLGKFFGTMVHQLLPMKLPIRFEPDSGPDDVLADFVQETAGLFEINDQIGLEIVQGLDRGDLGG